jgi:hypothetical protein
MIDRIQVIDDRQQEDFQVGVVCEAAPGGGQPGEDGVPNLVVHRFAPRRAWRARHRQSGLLIHSAFGTGRVRRLRPSASMTSRW